MKENVNKTPGYAIINYEAHGQNSLPETMPIAYRFSLEPDHGLLIFLNQQGKSEVFEFTGIEKGKAFAGIKTNQLLLIALVDERYGDIAISYGTEWESFVISKDNAANDRYREIQYKDMIFEVSWGETESEATARLEKYQSRRLRRN